MRGVLRRTVFRGLEAEAGVSDLEIQQQIFIKLQKSVTGKAWSYLYEMVQVFMQS